MKKLVTVFVLVFVVFTIAILSIKPKYSGEETPEQMLRRFEVERRAAEVKAEGEMLQLKLNRMKR
jgi:serine phosphatase RsbU (regulator of sigma subunit)